MIWILVAHRADARIIRSTGRRGSLHLVSQFEHPEGRKQNREIDTDAKGSRPSANSGQGHTTGGAGSSGHMRHGLDPHLEAVEHIADIFAKALALKLREGRTQHEFDEVILVAEPGFLGKIRRFLDKQTNAMVSATLNRNLTALPMHELTGPLDELVHDTRKVA
jgi:protein required for attachment to host cells